MRNLRAHRINYTALAGRGATAGLYAAAVMAVIAMVLGPAVNADTDGWSFFKVVSTILLGDDAATPLAGFDGLPVVIGLILHLAIGAFFGSVFACLVGLLDIEETVPVILAGLVYGVLVFLTSYLLIGQLAFPGFEQLPIIVGFWNHVAFGIVAGSVLGTWAQRYDIDYDPEAVRTP